MTVSIRFGYILMLIAHPLAIHYVFVFIPPFLQETDTQKGVRYSTAIWEVYTSIVHFVYKVWQPLFYWKKKIVAILYASKRSSITRTWNDGMATVVFQYNVIDKN